MPICLRESPVISMKLDISQNLKIPKLKNSLRPNLVRACRDISRAMVGPLEFNLRHCLTANGVGPTLLYAQMLRNKPKN